MHSNPMNAGFPPDPDPSLIIAARMHQRLSQSLLDLGRQVQASIPFVWGPFERACSRIAHDQSSPSQFAAYCELVLALHSGDLASAEQLFQELSQPTAPWGGVQIWRFADPAENPVSRRYERLFNTDPEQDFLICPPEPDEALRCERRVAAALALLERCDPDSHAELLVLIKEIVLASGPKTAGAMTFDGASSFMLFGAILLNTHGHETVLQTTEALIHESSHNLLFGLCADGSLIDNPDDARYDSPLRLDPRPMDGIVHATFVLARMYQGIRRLVDSGGLSAEQTEEAHTMLAVSASKYAEGWRTVSAHAQLTPLGKRVMQRAHAYMTPYLGTPSLQMFVGDERARQPDAAAP
ncbi:MAG: hypothetical protein B7Z32_07245 [Hydrogenophilales bacterium 12-64-13]|nr:MAG: hypothetical protein B7Z32_07245 [Hydrogenophilales bacterium 12-64-13]